MSNPRDFLLNTDYELDKIILVKTGSFVGSVDIPHDLGFTPLPFGVWSTDSNFNSVNSLGVTDTESPTPDYIPFLGVSCASSNNKIRLAASGDGKDTTTIYYRLYAFEPSDLNETTPTTSDLANTFILNTDYNYRKLKESGVFTQNGQEYTHNLGYIPQVMAWAKTSPDWGGSTFPVMTSSNFTGFKVIVTTTKISVGTIKPYTEKIYWRVYYDQA